jgi:hypothetical protein
MIKQSVAVLASQLSRDSLADSLPTPRVASESATKSGGSNRSELGMRIPAAGGNGTGPYYSVTVNRTVGTGRRAVTAPPEVLQVGGRPGGRGQ